MYTVVKLPIPANHAAFAGHFPGNPIVPGVVLLDETLYSIAATFGISISDCTVVSVKFLSAARPGDPLRLDCELSDGQRVRFTIGVLDRLVATGLLEIRAAIERSHAQ